jgi:sulfide:quinone oxidoreductase
LTEVSDRSRSTTDCSRVVIAGGGFAALEAALALRALAKERVRPTLVAPSPIFTYRPAATIEAFSDAPPLQYDLREIAADIGATYHQGTVEAVAAKSHCVRLESGKRLGYEYLVVAVGARARMAIPGALTFRDQRDIRRFRILLDELKTGRIGRLAFAVPSLDSWALPVYELAFLSAMHAARHGAEVEIVIVSPERAPLAVFGTEASRLLADLLAERRIRFVGHSIPHSVRRDGSLALQFDAPVEADRVVAVPELHGLRITGIPANWSGFVPIDSIGRVEGLTDVFAAGDVTNFPIKQGGLAAQQADLIAHTIAAEIGLPVKELHQARTLRARLLDGDGALVLRTELDALGRPTASTVEHRESRHAPDLKVFGLYLTPYLSIYRSRLEVAA